VKFGVWCIVCARRIAGPIFCNETINFERYLQVILGQFFALLTVGKILYGWLQQDSATAQTARIFMQTLFDVFGDRIINRGIWPARSPGHLVILFLVLFEGHNLLQLPPKGRRTKRKYS
jgi:hypothetical protein